MSWINQNWQFLKKYRIKILVGLVATLMVLIVAGVTIWQWERFNQLSGYIAAIDLKRQSQVMIELGEADSTKSGTLNLKFNIIDSDQPKILAISQRLGVGSDWTKGIKVTLNKESIEALRPMMPIEADVAIENNEIVVSRIGLGSLNSSLPSRDFEYASGGGVLKVQGSEVNNFNLQISEPAAVLKSATESGKLYLSNQLSGVYPWLTQIERITLQVSGDSLVGRIRLK